MKVTQIDPKNIINDYDSKDIDQHKMVHNESDPKGYYVDRKTSLNIIFQLINNREDPKTLPLKCIDDFLAIPEDDLFEEFTKPFNNYYNKWNKRWVHGNGYTTFQQGTIGLRDFLLKTRGKTYDKEIEESKRTFEQWEEEQKQWEMDRDNRKEQTIKHLPILLSSAYNFEK